MRRLTRMRGIWVIVGLVIVLGIGTGVVLALRQTQKQPVSSPEPVQRKEQVTPPAELSLQFAAMGDMLPHDSVVAQAKTADGYDFSGYFTAIKSLYTGSDAVFCNAESPSAGAAFGISGYPAFNAPTEFARDVAGAGCNVINLANNHMADKGQAALNATVDEWQKLKPLAVAGANRSAEEQNQVRYFEKNGLKVAFVAFADFSNVALPQPYSVNLYHDRGLVERLVREARLQADVVLASMHWGTEDTHVVNADQRAAARLLADLGVDVIVGTGPHVLQPVEWLERPDGGKTLVWYSIGNMLSSQLQSNQLTGGVALFKATKKDTGVIISDVQFKPTFMSYQWSAADKAAQRLLARHDLKLQPLAQAEAETHLFGTTVAEQTARVREWLGPGVEVTN